MSIAQRNDRPRRRHQRPILSFRTHEFFRLLHCFRLSHVNDQVEEDAAFDEREDLLALFNDVYKLCEFGLLDQPSRQDDYTFSPCHASSSDVFFFLTLSAPFSCDLRFFSNPDMIIQANCCPLILREGHEPHPSNLFILQPLNSSLILRSQ